MPLTAKSAAKAIYSKIPMKRRVFQLLRPLHPPRSLYQHLHFRGVFSVRVDDTSVFLMQANGEILENELFWAGFGGSWERITTRVWHRLSKISGGWILDVGANTGAYSLASRAVNPQAHIVAFEPVRRTAQRLRDNVALNGYEIQIEEKAVSQRNGEAVLHDTTDASVNYTASLEGGHGANTIQYTVETVSIDAYLAASGWPRIDLVKLDVEKHEPAAMQGMRETIKRFRPAIIVEVLEIEAGRQIAAVVAGCDYLMFNIDEEGGLIPTDTLQYLHGESWNNLLCTRDQFEAAGLQELLRDRKRG
jgi:FkbM family methyltransferase